MAFVQYHLDSYGLTWGYSRASFYGLQYTPTCWFDGLLERVGYPSTPTYSSTLSSRQSVDTDLTLELYAQSITTQDYEVTARLCLEPDGTAKTVKVQIVQVLDDWPATPSYHRNGFKKAATAHNVTLQPGECADVVETIRLDGPSIIAIGDVKFVAWAQQTGVSAPREVYQAATIEYPFPAPPVPCEALAVRSYNVHDSVGQLALDLGVSGGVESRSEGLYHLEVDMDNAAGHGGEITIDCSTPWSGNWITTAVDDTIILAFDPALPDAAACTITFDCGAEVCVRTLLGDIDGNGIVSTADASQVKPLFGVTPTDAEAHADLDGNGLITTSDLSAVKALFGRSAPDCP